MDGRLQKLLADQDEFHQRELIRLPKLLSILHALNPPRVFTPFGNVLSVGNTNKWHFCHFCCSRVLYTTPSTFGPIPEIKLPEVERELTANQISFRDKWRTKGNTYPDDARFKTNYFDEKRRRQGSHSS